MKYDWDEDKNIENQIKHGISFEEALPLLEGENFEIKFDDEHSTPHESRYQVRGEIEHHGQVIVVIAEIANIDDYTRIISARRA